MSRLIIMTGPCCAGKTTFVNKMKEEGKLDGFDIICPEEYYEAINGSAADRSNREWAWILIWHQILANMQSGTDTLVDANAPTECARTQYLEWFRGFTSHELIYIDTNVSTLCQHNEKRAERKLCGWDLITQWRKYEHPANDRRIDEWDYFMCWTSNEDGSFTLTKKHKKGEF